jgi:hypothetical protein
MKVWISQYATTKGLFEVEAEPCGNSTVRDVDRVCVYYVGEGRQWHNTRNEALTRAEQMRVKEIDALRRKLAKLEALDFSK